MESVMEVSDNYGHKYAVVKKIGSGGFGQVFRIQRQDDGTYWAMKTLPTHVSSEDLKSFKNEVSMAMQISHANAIQYIYVHDGSEQPGLPPYIIMPLANNGSLQDLIEKLKKEEKDLNEAELVTLFHQLIDGMEAVNLKIIHRDIKPANILVNDNKLLISDFGLAKLVNSVTRNIAYTFKGYGTLEYVAPEGWISEKNTIAMDIYAMGITFYQLATKTYPFKDISNNSLEAWKLRHLTEVPISLIERRIDLPVTLSQILMKMIEKKVQNRYKNWNEIRQDLLKISTQNYEKDNQIENLLRKRMDIQLSETAKELEESQKINKRQQHIQMVYSQFQMDIIQPLKEFVDKFNIASIEEKMIFHNPVLHSNEMSFKIKLASSDTLEVKMQVLFDEDFFREAKKGYYRDEGFYNSLHQRVVRPKYKNNLEILAWGLIKIANGVGYNILLLENKEEIYGDFVFLLNSQNPIVRHRTSRQQPIAFDYNELEEHVPLINTLSHYNTEVLEYSDEILTQFLVNYG
ncbi:serine/threonine protein kinase [Psychrobacillus sp. Sa2BUA9]|uniref:Serine/threonine protein kinase n=1 Tax=Psychrobacillus faecigallinarum TaxID=2762235 RepID=A0ABR8RD11_9BACI|nr:serine/threonine-protein kinase [Psychrobacillus faecigallinarum]MBD7945691.1 serine/threonine protein kinase [Psychrobacillus faecigallinarum]